MEVMSLSFIGRFQKIAFSQAVGSHSDLLLYLGLFQIKSYAQIWFLGRPNSNETRCDVSSNDFIWFTFRCFIVDFLNILPYAFKFFEEDFETWKIFSSSSIIFHWSGESLQWRRRSSFLKWKALLAFSGFTSSQRQTRTHLCLSFLLCKPHKSKSWKSIEMIHLIHTKTNLYFLWILVLQHPTKSKLISWWLVIQNSGLDLSK